MNTTFPQWTAIPAGVFPSQKDRENGLMMFSIVPNDLGSIADEEEPHMNEVRITPERKAALEEAEAIRLLAKRMPLVQVRCEFPHLSYDYIRKIVHGEVRNGLYRGRIGSRTRGRKTVKTELKPVPEIKGGKVFRSGKRSANNTKLTLLGLLRDDIPPTSLD